MALINQNSIIGITSITSPSASNVLTVHTNDTTERLRVSTNGVSFSGTNASLDTSGNLTIAGVLTYEDVSNVDSVGIVTARSGIHVTGGSVGIGTDNPTEKLEVLGTTLLKGTSSTATALRIKGAGTQGDDATISFTNGYTQTFKIGMSDDIGPARDFIISETSTGSSSDNENPKYIFNGNGDGIFQITDRAGGDVKVQLATSGISYLTGGNIGIGTNNPTMMVHIESGTPYIRSKNTAAPSDEKTWDFNAGTDGILRFRNINDAANSANNWLEVERNGVQTDSIRLLTGSGVERLRITSDGKIGISDTSPENTLSIKNIGSFEGDANSFYLGSNFTGTGQNFSGSGKHAQRFFFNNASSNGYLRYENTGTTGTAGNAITWKERFRVDSSGRVSINDNSRPASDASEGAQLRVTGTPLTRNQYYSPAGDYFGSFGYTDNTYTKSWIAVDSSYNKTSAVSSGIFLSAFHSDANGSACGHTIKNVRTDAGGLIFSSVHAASSTGNPAVETERLRITTTGTLESYSTNDTTPNIRWRSNDTNWFGALNQSVEGGTITSFLSCGGDWTANGTTYSATKALAAYPTSAIAVHNQYNSTWGSDFVFLSKLGGSSTTDGAVYEKLRINAKAEIIQTSTTTSTNSWYSLNSNNIVKVTNGDNDIYIERVSGSNDYDQLVYKKTPMTDNCDISFRLVGNAPNGTNHRHVGFTICGDGGSSWSDMDRIVFRYRPSNTGLNQIRIDKAAGGSTGSIQSSSIPNFFDSNERNILIQVRGRNIHILSDNVLVYSEEMDAALHSVTGYFGVSIYEAPVNNNPYIVLKNFQITNYGAIGVPQKRPCLQTNMSHTYGSSGSLTTNTANTGILQASAYVDLCGNYTTSGSNAYTFECPVDGVYAVNAHISMGGGPYARHIWVMSYTLGGGNLPLGTYTEVIDTVPDAHSNHSYYNLWKFTKGTRVGMGINSGSGSLGGRNFQWGIMLVS